MADTSPEDDRSAILLPCLVAMPTGLLRVPRSDMHHFIRGRNRAGRWDFKHGATPSLQVIFLIQRDGCLREVNPLRVRRQWARAFARLHDVVLLECEVAPPRQLTNAEWLGRLHGVPAKPPFDVAGKLRKFLKGLPEGEMFDESRFRQFWEEAGYPLPSGAWAESLS
jgi:hypothetical protein